MAEEATSVTIIKRGKKCPHSHHGGAWKVAYADFVTAMMAFFLLLWLLNAVTEEQLSGLSNYFAPTSVSKSTSGGGGMLGGQVIGEGAMPSKTASPSVTTSLPPPSMGKLGEDEGEGSDRGITDEEAAARQEQVQFEEAADRLRIAMQMNPDLRGLAQNILVDNTAEGLRIQLVDQEGTSMFPAGTSDMLDHTKRMLALVARVVNALPQKISISGHTDSVPFPDPSGYSNWELSADRALATRRVLLSAGVNPDRVARVVGRADTDPLVKEQPADARNRRISIVMLRDVTGKPEDAPPPLPLTRPPAKG
ncbi:MAG: OmpA family protein, partial [Alphaproteobacteria bacterium]|nr:OmpA family protein [Alphaproteobacteria bacterium]